MALASPLAHIAQSFTIDEQKVMNGGIINNWLEMNNVKFDNFTWFITSKCTLLNEQETMSLTLSSVDALKISAT